MNSIESLQWRYACKKFKYDKKTRNNRLTFILNKKIGDSFIKYDVNVNDLIEFISEEI